MDANDVVENLWYEAETIRRAVAAAYEAVSGPTPMPSSLTQVLAYIAENAGSGGGGCAPGQSCVTDALLQSAADALNGSHTATGGDDLVTEILIAIETVNVGLSVAVPRLILNEAPAPTVVGRVNQVDVGTLPSQETFGPYVLHEDVLDATWAWLSLPPIGMDATELTGAVIAYANESSPPLLTLADAAHLGYTLMSSAFEWDPVFEGGE